MSKTKTMTAGNVAAAADVNQNFDELGMLAYAEVTANQGTFTADTDLTGLTVTVTISAAFATAGRRIRIRGSVYLSSSVDKDAAFLKLKEGATQLSSASAIVSSSSAGCRVIVEYYCVPTAGAHTYKLVGAREAGTGNITMQAAASYPAFIIAEAV